MSDIVNEKRGFNANAALRLARYFGTTADVWTKLQQRFELEAARRELGDTLKHLHPRAA